MLLGSWFIAILGQFIFSPLRRRPLLTEELTAGLTSLGHTLACDRRPTTSLQPLFAGRPSVPRHVYQLLPKTLDVSFMCPQCSIKRKDAPQTAPQVAALCGGGPLSFAACFLMTELGSLRAIPHLTR